MKLRQHRAGGANADGLASALPQDTGKPLSPAGQLALVPSLRLRLKQQSWPSLQAAACFVFPKPAANELALEREQSLVYAAHLSLQSCSFPPQKKGL